jgi:predicted nucleic acid-binding protein
MFGEDLWAMTTATTPIGHCWFSRPVIVLVCGVFVAGVACVSSMRTLEYKVDIERLEREVLQVAIIQGAVSTNVLNPCLTPTQDVSELLKMVLPSLAGITFGYGTYVVLDETARMVRFRNTEENCRRFDEVISAFRDTGGTARWLKELGLTDATSLNTNEPPPNLSPGGSKPASSGRIKTSHFVFG